MKPAITTRESQILYLVAHEKTNKEIAKDLYLSTHTVITHRKNIMTKLQVKNTAGMIRRAFETGIIPLHQL